MCCHQISRYRRESSTRDIQHHSTSLITVYCVYDGRHQINLYRSCCYYRIAITVKSNPAKEVIVIVVVVIVTRRQSCLYTYVEFIRSSRRRCTHFYQWFTIHLYGLEMTWDCTSTAQRGASGGLVRFICCTSHLAIDHSYYKFTNIYTHHYNRYIYCSRRY